MLLSELLSAARVRVPLGSRTKADVFHELAELVAAGQDGADVEAIVAAVNEREQKLSTGIGDGIAIPHGRTPAVGDLVLAAGVSEAGIDYDALDGRPVRLFFMLVGPEATSGAHVKALARISRLMRREPLRQQLVAARTPEEFLRHITAAEEA